MVRDNKKKGAQGIGTLIIFIAMILVAAVAAAVLLQTASSLQSSALDVGRQSQEKITTDIEVVQMFVANTSDGTVTGGEDNLTVVVRLGSGSNPIKLDDMILKLDSSVGTQTVIFNGSSNYDENTYGVNFIINGSNSQLNYLIVGDLAELKFTLSNLTDIPESTSATLRVIARNGAVKPVDVTTPAAMVESTTYLYP